MPSRFIGQKPAALDIIEVMELLAPIRTHTFSDIPIPVISKGNRPMMAINVGGASPV
jgi:hypothetical protein